MEFYVMCHSYNCYGGHPNISLASEFLLPDGVDFGPAITELSVTLNFTHSGSPKKSLETMHASHLERMSNLPRVTFRRSRQQADIQVASDLMDGKDWDRKRKPSLKLFAGAVREVIAAIALLKQRLTKKDDFDLDGFLTHCADAQQKLPATEAEFLRLAEDLNLRDDARRAAKSPWQKLGIDFRDYHPQAREILDDVFYWDCTDDFAPHGNDTGADLLNDYKQWHRRNPAGDPLAFYKQQSRMWLKPDGSIDEIMLEVPDEAAVALAFAELKLRATCTPAVAELAREAIHRQRERAIAATTWSFRENRLERLQLLESKLP